MTDPKDNTEDLLAIKPCCALLRAWAWILLALLLKVTVLASLLGGIAIGVWQSLPSWSGGVEGVVLALLIILLFAFLGLVAAAIFSYLQELVLEQMSYASRWIEGTDEARRAGYYPSKHRKQTKMK
jgi:fatty acid desaturase